MAPTDMQWGATNREPSITAAQARLNFVRSDVMIEVVPGHLVKNINFEFQNCQVIPCFQPG